MDNKNTSTNPTPSLDLERIQRGCKHNYHEVKRTTDGYWFRCYYCGHQIFGSTKEKANG